MPGSMVNVFKKNGLRIKNTANGEYDEFAVFWCKR